MKHIVVRGGLLLMISCLLATACRTNRTTEKRNELLLEAPASSTAIQSNQRIIRQRAVTLNRSLLTSLPKPSGQQLVTGPENARQFSITLFNDASYVAVVDYFESPSPGTDAWTGHLANAEESFSMVVDATDILGEVRVAKKGAFRISSLGGPTLVSEIQPGQIVKKPDSVSKEKAFTSAATPPPAEDPPFVQDILVVYTPTARDDAAKAAGASPGSPLRSLLINV